MVVSIGSRLKGIWVLNFDADMSRPTADEARTRFFDDFYSLTFDFVEHFFVS